MNKRFIIVSGAIGLSLFAWSIASRANLGQQATKVGRVHMPQLPLPDPEDLKENPTHIPPTAVPEGLPERKVWAERIKEQQRREREYSEGWTPLPALDAIVGDIPRQTKRGIVDIVRTLRPRPGDSAERIRQRLEFGLNMLKVTVKNVSDEQLIKLFAIPDEQLFEFRKSE